MWGRVGEGGSRCNRASPSRTAPRSRPRPRGEGREARLHTLYISPLKALAVDIARNLETPVREMGLPIRLETRTGDTPASKRQRQRRDPPDILLTTPEQLALLLATADAPYLFGTLRRVVLDELHSLVTVQARRPAVARPGAAVRAGAGAHHRRPVRHRRRAGRSAAAFWCRSRVEAQRSADLVVAQAGAQPQVTMLDTAGAAALGRPFGAPRAR